MRRPPFVFAEWAARCRRALPGRFSDRAAQRFGAGFARIAPVHIENNPANLWTNACICAWPT